MPAAPPPLHIVTLIDLVAEAGGAETLASTLVERLDPARFRRTLVLYRRLDDPELRASRDRVVRRLRAAGVRVLCLDGRNRWDLASWAPLLRLLRRERADVLHAHKFGPNAWGAIFARLARVPVFVAHEHTWSFEGKPLRRLTDRWLIATRSDAFLAVSNLDASRMHALEGVPADRIRVLPNGIPDPVVDEPVDLRATFGIAPDVPVLGTIGVFRPQKDLTMLLHAHARLQERHPGAHLVLVGDGPERGRLEALCAELGLGADLVSFAGYRRDAVRLAASFDIAINSSRFEGASLAILEFMALGVPIVATAVGGTPELLAGGEAGVLVAPGDVDQMTEGISRLLDAPQEARRLAAQARRRQREIYSIDVQLQRLQDLYVELRGATARRG